MTVWKPWTGEPTLESVVAAYCAEQRCRYELLDELAELRSAWSTVWDARDMITSWKELDDTNTDSA